MSRVQYQGTRERRAKLAQRDGNASAPLRSSTNRKVVIKNNAGAKVEVEGLNPYDNTSGDWLGSDPKRDERQLLKKDLGPDTPWGKQVLGEDTIDWLQQKKDQAEHARELEFALRLVDPSQPNSAKDVLKKFHELQDIPEQAHRDSVVFQEALRKILKNGYISGPEDNRIMMRVFDPDYILPTNPLWDPEGFIVDKFNANNILVNGARKKLYFAQKGLISTLFDRPADQYESELTAINAVRTEQLKMKKAILLYLYPGFREETEEAIDAMLKGQSQFLDSQTPQAYVKTAIKQSNPLATSGSVFWRNAPPPPPPGGGGGGGE